MNCGRMALDWRTLSLSGYIEALAAHNAANNPDGATAPADTTGLARFMAAHGATLRDVH